MISIGTRIFRTAVAVTTLIVLAGCSGVQSALSPIGDEAARVNVLFWVMTIGGAVILAIVAVAAAMAMFGTERLRMRLARDSFVVGAGLVFPAVTLTALLVAGLLLLAVRTPTEGDDTPAFASITGEQWWWRVVYHLPDGERIESANELRIPVGVPVRLALETADVLHSFWVPRLAGKLDMIPGRTNVLTLQATEPGISRGQCAEFCGGAHAFMAFHVVALPVDVFAAWREAEAGPATEPTTAELQRGAEIFDGAGCGACHTVRGAGANGTIGPDLTHVGSRHSLAAATLPNDAAAFANWIRNNQHIKPENKMPPFDILSDEELALLARYLESLK